MSIRAWIHTQLKKKCRIYIMPTKMGGYLNGLIFLMFLLSVGYGNNLLLIFTLLIFGLNLIWVIQTHFHLHALKIETVLIEDAHALEKTLITIYLKKGPHGPYQWELSLEGNATHKLTTIENLENSIQAQLILSRRGHYQFEHIRVKTEMPFGLYRAWIYYPIKTEAYVYPVLIKETLIQGQASKLEGEKSTFLAGSHDIWNLGPYQGEESRKISWKHYARSGELVVKQGEELTQPQVQFKVEVSGPNIEYFLSLMATQMRQCSRTDTQFSLETSHLKTNLGSNEKHLRACLRELSKC